MWEEMEETATKQTTFTKRANPFFGIKNHTVCIERDTSRRDGILIQRWHIQTIQTFSFKTVSHKCVRREIGMAGDIIYEMGDWVWI